MPTLRKDRGNVWMARVVIDGKEVDSRFFPAGRKKGPEWMAAREWELARKKELLEQKTLQEKTLTDLDKLLAWGERYLAFVEKTMSHSTYIEKQTVMKSLFSFCHSSGVSSLEGLTKAKCFEFLCLVADQHGTKRANVYRKNLVAAWSWAEDAIEDFPQHSPLNRVKPFPVEAGERYVPSEEDVIKVMREASGQDLVMLLTFYFTGARRNEVFRLTWSDINWEAGQIKFTDHKAGNGNQRSRWVAMHPELTKALSWWYNERPVQTECVFMQLQSDAAYGQPFTQRNRFMPRLCEKAGVKPFGFHAMRHKAAAIAFMGGGLLAAQTLMGHYRATTTDLYVRSAGLYANQQDIVAALGESRIGMVADELLKREMPRELEPHEALFCNHKTVTTSLQ